MADGTMYPEKGVIKTISGQVNVTTGSVNLRAEFTILKVFCVVVSAEIF
jgi:hypothetical protein